MMKQGAQFEQLVESIYRELDSSSQITRNDKILGRDSGIEREIDVSIRGSIGLHKLLIIIQAKDYKKACDVNIVGEFAAVIADVGANKGVLVSSQGFTQAARTMARSKGIELLTAHDNASEKWKIKLEIPVVITSFLGGYTTTFDMVANDEYVQEINKGRVIKVPHDGRYKFSSDKGKTLFIPLDDFREKYLNMKLDSDGMEKTIHYPEMELQVEDALFVPARNIQISYQLRKNSYWKKIPLRGFRGFIDRITDNINPAHYRVENSELIIENNIVKVIKSFDLSKWESYNDQESLRDALKIIVFHFPMLQTGPTGFRFIGNETK